MGKFISLYDDDGRLRSIQALGAELTADHAGIAPKGLLVDLRKRHEEAVKLGLGAKIEETTENTEYLIDAFFNKKRL